MIEKKIYGSYAFSEDRSEKEKCNAEIFEELENKYKIFRKDNGLTVTDGVDCNFADYDIIIGRKPKYHHTLYRIYKNVPNLSEDELALICDYGDLCFGYRVSNGCFYVFED